MREPIRFSKGTGRTTPTSKPRLDDLKTLMQQAVDYFPNQTLPPGTIAVYLKAWVEIAAQYGYQTFHGATWRVLRRSNFFPTPAVIEQECLAMPKPPARANLWTVERYRECREFDRYLEEQPPGQREQICQQHQGIASARAAWKNQLAAGTLHCRGWCDDCEGRGLKVITDAQGKRLAVPCPSCEDHPHQKETS